VGVVPIPFGNDEAPVCRGFVDKRLKRFELSTFCMAITPVLESPRGANVASCRAFVMTSRKAPTRDTRGYAAICRRFGHSCA